MAYKNYDMLSLQQKINEVDNKAEKKYVEDNITKINSSLEESAKNKVNYVNVITMFGAKGDGITDDTNAIKNAISYCITNDQTLYFPSGHIFAVSSTLEFTKRINIEGYGAEIKALNTMASLVMINESVYYDGNGTELENRLDLYEVVTMHLPKLNANNLATINLYIKKAPKVNYGNINLIKCKGTSISINQATESIIDNLSIYAGHDINSIGVLVTSNDCTINTVNAIDCHTAIKTKAVNIFNNVHAWIMHEDLLEGSTFFEMYETELLTNRLNHCYADTYQYIFKSSKLKQNIQANLLFVTYNTTIYTDSISQPYLFYCTADANDGAFNWSSLTNSYIQGCSGTNKLIFSNSNVCNAKFDSSSFFVNINGIRKVSNTALTLKDGVTVNKRNRILRDGGNVNLTFNLKIDVTVTGRTNAMISIGNITEPILQPYDRQCFFINCSDTDTTDLPTALITTALLENYSTNSAYSGLMRIKIPTELLGNDTIYISGSISYLNRQIINSSLDYNNDVT